MGTTQQQLRRSVRVEAADPAKQRSGSDELDLVAIREEMYARLGKCLVRLQQYELLMKAFATHNQIEAPATALAQALESREKRFADKTLGHIVGEVVDNVFMPDGWEPESDESTHDGVWVRAGFTVRLPEDALATVRSSLASLVQLRNDLVHGFMEHHDIRTVAGLSSAINDLDTAYAEIGERFLELRGWWSRRRYPVNHIGSRSWRQPCGPA